MSATPQKKPVGGAPTGFVMPPIMTTACHFVLYVPEARWKEAISFFQDKIGLMLRVNEDGKWAEYNAGSITFALHGAADPKPRETGLVFEVDHCDDAVAMLKARGIKVTVEPKHVAGPGSKRCFSFQDLFGNTFEGYGT